MAAPKKLLKKAIREFKRKRIIGEIEVNLPYPPRLDLIANHNLPIEKQKFYYTEQPKNDEELSIDFLEQEFKRIKYGYWFFNNGNLEYITGAHYFLLNYWKDKGKRLVFIDAQRDVYHWWMEIELNTNLAGGNLITNRRFGKTVVGTSILYYRTATASNRRGGIQSKTNKDGKDIFDKLVTSWMRLPDWLKPIDSGETRPATTLEFFEPRKRSSKDSRKIYGEALWSSIDYKPSVEEGYDGQELHTYYEDETGKTIEVNTDIRWKIVKYCLLKGSTIIGKSLRTTTVEEMEKKGGENMKKTWDGSKMKTLNPKTGRTETLLTNLFIPADYGYYSQHPVTGEWFVDEYGYSKRDIARQYIMDTWEGLEGEDLASEQRKNPLEERHVWQMKNFSGTFDLELLEIQKDYLEGNNQNDEDNAPKNLIRKVTFYRDDDGLVKWKDDPNGYFEMVWDFNNQSNSNKRKINSLSGLYEPMNTENFAIGVDPFAATIITGNDKSMGVAYVYRKGDVNDPDNSGLMVVRYAQRTRFKSQFHRNIMLLCQYYGCKANYESDIDDFYEKFLEEGFKHYIMWRPKSTIDPQRKNIKIKYGTPSKDRFSLQKQIQIADEYIKTRYHKIYFLPLINQLIKFDPDNRTKFDDAIAFFMALIGGTENVKTIKEPVSLKILPLIR